MCVYVCVCVYICVCVCVCEELTAAADEINKNLTSVGNVAPGSADMIGMCVCMYMYVCIYVCRELTATAEDQLELDKCRKCGCGLS